MVEQELEKDGGKVYAFFADMRAAFDKLKKAEIWRMIRKLGVSERIIERTREIYGKTECEVKIGDKVIGSFETYKEVRRGCPLSPLLFKVAMADIEEEIGKIQEGGVVLGRRKIWSISYADDVVLLATNAGGLKQMMRKFKRVMERKGLELNTEKSKVIIFRNGGRRGKEDEFKWDGQDIEVVKKFEYLGYVMKKNGKEDEQIKKLKGKASAMISTVWGIGESLFR